jgi:hypothetical protein
MPSRWPNIPSFCCEDVGDHNSQLAFREFAQPPADFVRVLHFPIATWFNCYAPCELLFLKSASF